MRNPSLLRFLPLTLLAVGCVDDVSSPPSVLLDAGSEPAAAERDASPNDAARTDGLETGEPVDNLTIDLGGSDVDELTIIQHQTSPTSDAGRGSGTGIGETSIVDPASSSSAEMDASASDESNLDAGAPSDQSDTSTDVVVSPLRCAAAVGSPHIVTFDGLSYDMQPVGELVLTRHHDLELQVRTAAWPGRTDLSVVTAVAARIGADRVAFYLDGRVVINGEPVGVTNDGYELASGGRVSATDDGYLLEAPSGAQLRVPTAPSYLGVVLCVPDSYQGALSGMFGDFDGEPNDDILALGDDDFLTTPAPFERFYGDFVRSWRVMSETSLFDYAPDQGTSDHTDLTFPRRLASTESVGTAERDAALQECITASVSFPWQEACSVVVALTEDQSFGSAFSQLPHPTAHFAIERSIPLLEGCTRVSEQRPATTPNVSAPLVAGLTIAPGAPGEPLLGSVRFQDAENDATTLLVQVGSSSDHYRCTLNEDELTAGAVALDALSLSNTFPDGGHTLYVGVMDNAGNVSGYIAGNLDVGGGGAQPVCGQAPRLLLGAVPSQTTTFYAQQNGISLDYNAGGPLAIVASADLFLKVDGCTHLYLAGDSAGETAVGWDNCLLVEYRETPESPREAVWSYCSLPVFEEETNERVPMAEEVPTVPGTSLNPPIPNQAPFGWSPLALDLSRYLPEDHPNEFVLNLRLLDFGTVGSTTDVWMVTAPPDNFEQH